MALNREDAGEFVDNIYKGLRSKGLWLADHPFVMALRAGEATRDEVFECAKQFFFVEEALNTFHNSVPVHIPHAEPSAERNAIRPQTLKRVEFARHVGLFVELGVLLGLSREQLPIGLPNRASLALREWAVSNDAPEDCYLGPICGGILSAIACGLGHRLADGVEQHYEVKAEETWLLRAHATQEREHSRRVISLFAEVPMERWEYVHHQVSIQSHLIFEICNSAGTMYSSW
jgi:hypothetical protein